MIVALIDNGSLEPAAHRNLRTVAAALAARCDTHVHAVSWQHSDRVAPAALGGAQAWTLAPFVRARVALGQREFVFVPFFISAQGAIGSALRHDLENLQHEVGGFEFAFTAGLAAQDAIPVIAAARIRETMAAHSLRTPPVVVVDHGGPSSASAKLRDDLADRVRSRLAGEIGPLVAASMEGHHPPLLAEQLRTPEFAAHAAVVALLFLAPGRHAGPAGDIAALCRASPAQCHLSELIGTHPLAIDALATALRDTLPTLQVQSFA
jgi:hypothetical protein